MAENQFAVRVPEVHSVSLTIPPVFASGALVAAHPFAVAVRSEPVFPDIDEVVLVDIALTVVGTDAGTGGDASVSENRPYADSGLTIEEMTA